MKKLATCATTLMLILVGWIAVSPHNVRAQDSSLKAIITRPGVGETFYSSPTAPFTAAPVTGWVSADDFNVRQLQVRLEVLQGTKLIGSLTTTPLADGTYSFDVGINSNPEDFLASPEKGCTGNCHSLLPLSLPSGAVLLRVTVTDPLGRKATAERSIIVDQSGYADVPVRVVAAGNSQKPIHGLTVVGVTRLYEWRARQYTAKTDAKGSALLHIEALAQAPTRYHFYIEPTILDGVLYRGRELQVTLSPGATTIEPVTLIAETLHGQIDGAVALDSQEFKSPLGLTVRAIEMPRGAAHIAGTVEGKFSLAELPISNYLIAVDEAEAAAHGWQAPYRLLDLSTSPIASTTLMLSSAPARTARGLVRDSQGSPLSFAWMTTVGPGKTSRVSPTTGAFALYGLSPGTRALWVTAPGYWSRPVALGWDELDITLTRQPDTRIIPWGAGTLTLPPPTIADLSGDRLSLKRGWVWGKGYGSLSINTPDLDIELHASSFALEYLPGETSWLYMAEGQAQVTVAATDEALTVGAGQMLAFGKGVTHPLAVSLDDAVVRALHIAERAPVLVEPDPAPLSRVRDELEQLGIPAEKTLFGVLLGAILAVTCVLLLMHRRRQQ